MKSWSYSVKEVADLLGVDEYLVYDLLKKNQMEAVIVDYWKRIPKESQKRVFKNFWKVKTGISWIHRMIMKNLHRTIFDREPTDIFDVCTRVWGIGIPIKRLTRRYAVAIK